MTLTDTNAHVTLISKIITDGEPLNTRLEAPATFYKENDTYVLMYKNREQACDTKVVVDSSSVSVTHSGSVETTMVFKNEYTYKSNYGLEYGELDLEVRTERIFVDINTDGGSIELWYTLILGGSESDAKMIIEITK